MENCVFCKVVHGELPSTKVYEDEHFLAFLDIRPQAPGHTLVIPKEHYRWVWDLPAGRQASPNLGDYFEVVGTIARALQKAFGVEMVLSKIIGEEVPHAHIWLFPDPVNTQGDKMDFATNAEKIRSSLS